MKILGRLLMLSLLALSGAGAFWYFCLPVTLVVSFERLQVELATHLPQDGWDWGIGRFTLAPPQLEALSPERLRLRAEGHLSLPYISGVSGAIVANTGIKFMPDQGTFYLHDLQIEDLSFATLPVAQLKPIRDLANQTLPLTFNRLPVYRLDPALLPARAGKDSVQTVQIGAEGLKLSFCNTYAPAMMPGACPPTKTGQP